MRNAAALLAPQLALTLTLPLPLTLPLTLPLPQPLPLPLPLTLTLEAASPRLPARGLPGVARVAMSGYEWL